MDTTLFKALRPEFASSTYDARIAALLTMLPDVDADRAGNQLNMGLSAWMAWKLSRQDYAITFGAGASVGSSNSVDKRVGDVSISRSSSSTSSLSNSGGKGRASNAYEAEWDDYVRVWGMGAVAVGSPGVVVA